MYVVNGRKMVWNGGSMIKFGKKNYSSTFTRIDRQDNPISMLIYSLTHRPPKATQELTQ